MYDDLCVTKLATTKKGGKKKADNIKKERKRERERKRPRETELENERERMRK